MTIDIERMLRECLPGGNVLDPQRVADDIREWFAAQPVGAEPPGCPTPGACSCPAAVAQVVVENQMPRDLDELNRWINVANARGFAKGIEVRPCLESARKVLAPEYDDSAPPIWETLGAIGRSDPKAWEAVKGAEPAAELWCVHVQGPDDLYAETSKEAAEQHAKGLNEAIQRQEHHPLDPHVAGVAMVWPYSPEAHAADLAKRAAPPPAAGVGALMHKTELGIVSWLSAALEDDKVCAEMKADIRAWMQWTEDRGAPLPAAGAPDAREALAGLVRAIQLEMSTEWDCNSYHPALYPTLETARKVLADKGQS